MSYINEIAEKMKNGRASLMIGAGFSKNAVPNMPTNKKFLTWNELGDVFYEKLYNHKPESNERYLNVLKLAEEVDAISTGFIKSIKCFCKPCRCEICFFSMQKFIDEWFEDFMYG